MTTIERSAMKNVMGGCGCGQQQPQQQPPAQGGDAAGQGASPPAQGAGDASAGASSPAAGGCNWMSLLQGLMGCLQSKLGGATPAAGQQPQG